MALGVGTHCALNDIDGDCVVDTIDAALQSRPMNGSAEVHQILAAVVVVRENLRDDTTKLP